jgi:tetratricopeptide (TPR) repeat protein
MHRLPMPGDIDAAGDPDILALHHVVQQALQAVPPEQSATVDRLYRQMKEDATYWLGVATLGEGQPEAAIDYLRRMTLENSPDSRWTDAARANLGRALASLGRIDEAVKVLREDGSPQRFGSRLLADRLEADRLEKEHALGPSQTP